MAERIFMFRPLSEGNTVNIAATGSTGNVALGIPAASMPQPEIQCEIYNADDTDVVFVQFGGSGVTASATASRPIPPGQWVVADVPAGATHVAAITSGGNATAYFTPGTGS